ncbi:hypothetical protein SAY87_020775 [Trapa incisa]|uniref:Uncharacterized protein n=1 Tax=Trapa incisa TaxID=236973 RepID=A0AAN7JQN1_9MYRT|nr:hypothetical protein SAY87_020775 [Trapa incisa]
MDGTARQGRDGRTRTDSTRNRHRKASIGDNEVASGEAASSFLSVLSPSQAYSIPVLSDARKRENRGIGTFLSRKAQSMQAMQDVVSIYALTSIDSSIFMMMHLIVEHMNMLQRIVAGPVNTVPCMLLLGLHVENCLHPKGAICCVGDATSDSVFYSLSLSLS